MHIRRSLMRLAGPLLVAATALYAQNAGQPTVHIQQGTLAGAVDAQGVRSFKGIPFASAPVGDLRWKPPAAPKPWTGLRQATAWGAACMQNLRRDTLPWTKEFMVQNDASEDCLSLNVWTPKADTHARLPVLVFIHGGGFNEGSGGIAVYDGAALASRGIVVVTINYRLGIFGFFTHPELTAESPRHSSGNYGFLDQVQALKWVRSNIGAFGGDASKVTIWGQSAGAFSIGALVASPLAKGLFEGAMADSALNHTGTVMPPLHDAEQDGVAYAKAKGAVSLKDLRALSANELMQAIPGVRFRPVIDGWVLPENPRDLMEKGGDSDVPLITGNQSEDGRSLSRPPVSVQQYEERIHQVYGSFADEILKLYPVKSETEVKPVIEALGRDRNRVSMYIFARRRSGTHKSPVYTYFFDRAIPWPQHPEFGAFHTGELPYLFANLDKLDRPWTDKDREVSRITSQYVVNFTKTGQPNGSGLPTWPKVGEAKQTMELGETFGPMPLADAAKQDVWMRFLMSPGAEKAPVF